MIFSTGADVRSYTLARIHDIPVRGMHVTLLRRGDPREVIAPGI